MLVLVLGGGLRDDDVSALAGRGVGDRFVVVARAALAADVVEQQLAELERHADGHRGQKTDDQQTARSLQEADTKRFAEGKQDRYGQRN